MKRSIVTLLLALNFPTLALAGPFLKSEWPLPNGGIIQTGSAGPIALLQSIGEDNPPTDTEQPRDAFQPDVKQVALPLSGKDPMVAAGRNFVIASTSGMLSFLDKEGTPLDSINGIASIISINTLFGEFLDPDSPNDINKHTGFIVPCDSPQYPDTTINKFCVGTVLDSRVYFDPAGNRFIILAEAKNAIRTDLWRPDGQAKKFSGSKDGFEWCGVYAEATTGDDVPLPQTGYCSLARRHQFFAISKTEDPRDGFFIYAMKKQNYVDFPWGAVNAEGDTFTIGVKNPASKYGYVAMVIRLSDLRNGSPNPRYFRLFRDDLLAAHPNTADTSTSPYKDNLYNPAPIVHHGAAAGLKGYTLMLSPLNRWTSGYNPDTLPGTTDKLRVFGFGSPQGQGAKPSLIYGEATAPDAFLPGFMLHSVYRNGNLHVAWQVTEVKRPKRKQLRYIRMPISVSSTPGNGIKFQSELGGRPRYWVADFLEETHQFPALAVNASEQLIIPYRRGGGAEIRMLRWYPESNQPASAKGMHMHLAEVPWIERNIDYAWATVDPSDDQTFWFAQRAQIQPNFSQFHLYRVRLNP